MKMVRRKQHFDSFPGTVQLLLIGPRSILSSPLLVSANLGNTWYELLNRTVGLEVAPESGIFVCTKSYTPCNPKNGVGWRAELNEKIGEFVNKFERRKRQHHVRICNPVDILAHGNQNRSTDGTPPILARQGRSSTLATTAGNVRIAPSTSRPAQRPSIVIPAQKISANVFKVPLSKPGNNSGNGRLQNVNRQRQQLQYGNRFKRHQSQTVNETNSTAGLNQQINGASGPKRAKAGNSLSRAQERLLRIDNVRSVVKTESVMEPEWNPMWDDINNPSAQQKDPLEMEDNTNSGQDSRDSGHFDMEEEEEIDDNASLCTAATQENNELRREGIQVEDVLSSVQGRITRFSNAYMLRVRNEIQKLQKNNSWDRNVSRAPLSSYLLQELFKE